MDFVEAATDEFQEWELLQTSSDSESEPVISPDHPNSFDEFNSGGLIQPDYFSLELDSAIPYGEHVIEGESVGSGNPVWIDPGFGEDPDIEPERSEDREFIELEDAAELGFCEKEEKDVKFEGIEGKGEASEDLGSYCMNSGGIAGDSTEFSGFGENNELGVEGNVDSLVESPVLGEGRNEIEGIGSGGGVVDGAENKNGGELQKRGIVWWKMPMEFLKYCMIRMSPVWTVSITAAVMGFLILGRRLYKMKRKTRGLQIKVAVDDKKASQVMSRASRLNEAFSVVKLVPVIRPSLPAVGSTSNWAVMSLR